MWRLLMGGGCYKKTPLSIYKTSFEEKKPCFLFFDRFGLNQGHGRRIINFDEMRSRSRGGLAAYSLR